MSLKNEKSWLLYVLIAISWATCTAIGDSNSFDVYVKKNDNLQAIFRRHNLSLVDFFKIVNSDSENSFTKLMPGQRIHFVTEKVRRIKKMVVYKTNSNTISAQKDEVGQFWVKKQKLDDKKIFFTKHFTINHSLYKDGRAAGLTIENIRDLTSIITSDATMNVKKMPVGAEIYVVLERDIWDKPNKKNITAVEVQSKRKKWTAMKFSGQDSQADFYHEDGSAISTSFLKYPLANFYVSSPFSLDRKHPIYNTRRPHYGVDLASPRGSPVWTTAKGKVVFAGVKGGYGKVIEIQHGQHYRTVYAHLSNFRKGLKVGDEVDQKQIIGYVGSTGAATGPHLHYEIRKDGQPRNPLRIALPTINKLSGTAWEKFKGQISYYQRLLHDQGGK